MLGQHARQQGSLVDAGRLRFDFATSSPSRPSAWPRSRRPSTASSWPTRTCGSGTAAWPRPRRPGRSRCSARSTARWCGWSTSATSRASCAAAPTSATAARSGPCTCSARPRSGPTCAASRPSPDWRRCTTSTASASSWPRWRPCSRPGPRTPPSSCGAGWTRWPPPSGAGAPAGRRAGAPGRGAGRARVQGGGRLAGGRAGAGGRSRRPAPDRHRGPRPGRARPGVVVLGSETQGKAAMVALLTTDLASGSAGAGAAVGDVLARAAKAVGGGAGAKGDLASAGGRDSQLGEALRLAGADALSLLDGGPGAASRGPGERGRQGRRGMTGRVLALDVGTRRLGVAVSDPTGTVASPLATIPRRTPAEDAAALAALAAEHDATTVVVGLTLAAEARPPGPSGPTWRAAPAAGRPGPSWPTSACRGRRAGTGRRRGPAPGPAPGRRPGRGQRLPPDLARRPPGSRG